jgi:hypothetical protein
MTLCDTIRHEYAHAWYYIDREFFRQAWFERTFGAPYDNCASSPYQSWRRNLKRDPSYQEGKSRRKTDHGKLKFFYGCLYQQFITDYASTNASEDFAETFMFFVKYRRSLSRFRNRPVEDGRASCFDGESTGQARFGPTIPFANCVAWIPEWWAAGGASFGVVQNRLPPPHVPKTWLFVLVLDQRVSSTSTISLSTSTMEIAKCAISNRKVRAWGRGRR